MYNKMLFGALAVFALTACSKQEETSKEAPLVRLATVHRVSAAEHASYPGRTKAAQTANVAFRVSGTIDKVNVKDGDPVYAGQVIAQLDDRDYKVQLAATEAEYNQTKADCERVIGLYQDGSTTAQNYDKARYGLEQITAKYNHAKDQLADCQLKAPFSGYVQNVLHEADETVLAGIPVISVFCSNSLEVEINIPASEYVNKHLFSAFNVSFDVLPGQSFPLRLISIAQRANANQLYEVRLLLENNNDNKEVLKKVTPGMVALVDIEYADRGAAPVEVPAGAVFHKGGYSFVYIYTPDGDEGTIHKTPVYVSSLRSEGTMTVTGLEVGSKIVECGVHHLEDGQRVRPNPTPSEDNVGGLL